MVGLRRGRTGASALERGGGDPGTARAETTHTCVRARFRARAAGRGARRRTSTLTRAKSRSSRRRTTPFSHPNRRRGDGRERDHEGRCGLGVVFSRGGRTRPGGCTSGAREPAKSFCTGLVSRRGEVGVWGTRLEIRATSFWLCVRPRGARGVMRGTGAGGGGTAERPYKEAAVWLVGFSRGVGGAEGGVGERKGCVR